MMNGLKTVAVFAFWSLAVGFIYTTLGTLTYEPTVQNLDRACIARPSLEAHRFMWPASWALSVGVESKC